MKRKMKRKGKDCDRTKANRVDMNLWKRRWRSLKIGWKKGESGDKRKSEAEKEHEGRQRETERGDKMVSGLTKTKAIHKDLKIVSNQSLEMSFACTSRL